MLHKGRESGNVCLYLRMKAGPETAFNWRRSWRSGGTMGRPGPLHHPIVHPSFNHTNSFFVPRYFFSYRLLWLTGCALDLAIHATII